MLKRLKLQAAFDAKIAKTPIPLDGDSATIRNVGQNDTKTEQKRQERSRSVVEAPRS